MKYNTIDSSPKTVKLREIKTDISIVKTVFSGQTFQWQTYNNTTYTETDSENTAIIYRVFNQNESPTNQPEVLWIIQNETTEFYGTSSQLDSVIDRLFYKLETLDPAQDVQSFLSTIELSKDYQQEIPAITLISGNPTTTLYEFICSQQMSIDRIYKMNSTLRSEIGSFVTVLDRQHSAFPTPQQIVEKGSLDFLKELKLGYRAKYVYNTSKQITTNEPEVPLYNTQDTSEIRETLQEFYGVGDKVADCTLLYGYGDLSTVPIDTWMKKYVNAKLDLDTESYSDYQRVLKSHLRDDCQGLDQLYLFYLLSSGHLSLE